MTISNKNEFNLIEDKFIKMECLKGYESYGKFKLIGMGRVHHTKVEIFDLGILEKTGDDDFPNHNIRPVILLDNDDEEALAFALVSLDCGEHGKYDKFMVGEPTYSHWKLYKKAIENYNEELTSKFGDKSRLLTINEVKKIDAGLDGRIWTVSKVLVLKSYANYEERLLTIYHNLLFAGVDISDYSLLLPKLIPEIEDFDVALRGVYSCKISDLLTQ